MIVVSALTIPCPITGSSGSERQMPLNRTRLFLRLKHLCFAWEPGSCAVRSAYSERLHPRTPGARKCGSQSVIMIIVLRFDLPFSSYCFPMPSGSDVALHQPVTKPGTVHIFTQCPTGGQNQAGGRGGDWLGLHRGKRFLKWTTNIFFWRYSDRSLVKHYRNVSLTDSWVWFYNYCFITVAHVARTYYHQTVKAELINTISSPTLARRHRASPSPHP